MGDSFRQLARASTKWRWLWQNDSTDSDGNDNGNDDDDDDYNYDYDYDYRDARRTTKFNVVDIEDEVTFLQNGRLIIHNRVYDARCDERDVNSWILFCHGIFESEKTLFTFDTAPYTYARDTLAH